MRSFRARQLDNTKPLQIHSHSTIPPTSPSDPHRKTFLHNEPKSDERFNIPIIIPVIVEKERMYEIGMYEPPETYIRHAYLNYEAFTHRTHYTLDDDDFLWLDNERQLMENSVREGEWRRGGIDVNSPGKVLNGGTNGSEAPSTVSPGPSALTTVRPASVMATKSPKSKKSSHPRAKMTSKRILRDEDEIEELEQKQNGKGAGSQQGTTNATPNGNTTTTTAAAAPNDTSTTPAKGTSQATTVATPAHPTTAPPPLATGDSTTSTSSTTSSASEIVVIFEDLMEDIMDRCEKVAAKSVNFFPKLWDIEPYVPQKYAHIKNLNSMIGRIYGYWKAKRKRRRDSVYPVVGKPLLRQFQIPPDISDDDPRKAFRPRNKDLANKKPFPNDAEALSRLKVMRAQLERLHKMVWMIQNRELIHKDYVDNAYQLMKSELEILQKQQSSGGRPMVSRKRKRVPTTSGAADRGTTDENRTKPPHTFSLDKIYRSLLENDQKLCPQFLRLNQVGDLPAEAMKSSTALVMDGDKVHFMRGSVVAKQCQNGAATKVSHFLDPWGTSIVECREVVSEETLEKQRQQKRRRIDAELGAWGTFSLFGDDTRGLAADSEYEDDEDEESFDEDRFASPSELGFERVEELAGVEQATVGRAPKNGSII